MSMFASFIVASTPELARADLGEPDYDPVFYYYHSDHLGSSEIMTDRDSDPVQHYGYQPYGNERYKHNTNAFSVTNRFTGQQLDEDIGLYYYSARYYDPELGRFIQPDSVVPGSGSQALNRYSYCFNNPLIFTDPTGNTPLTIFYAFNAALNAEPAVQGSYWNAAAGTSSGAFEYLGGGLSACPTGGALGALITGDDPGMVAATSGINFTILLRSFDEYDFLAGDAFGDQYLKGFDSKMLYYNKLFGLSKEDNYMPTAYDWAKGILSALDDGVVIMSNAMTLHQLEGRGISGWADSPDAIQRNGVFGSLSQYCGYTYSAAMAGAVAIESLGLDVVLWGTGTAASSNPNELGLYGEKVVRTIYDIGDKGTIVVNNNVRIPDGISNTAVSEVKNVAYQAWTRQLADYAQYAHYKKIAFDLYVRTSTILSSTVQAMEQSGTVNVTRVNMEQ